MCHGEGCALASQCYRFTAKPDEYLQSWFETSPVSGETCVEFIPENDKRPVVKPTARLFSK